MAKIDPNVIHDLQDAAQIATCPMSPVVQTVARAGFRIMRGINCCCGPIGLNQAFFRRLPFRAAVGGRTFHDATVPKNHHITRLIQGFRNQGDAFCPPLWRAPSTWARTHSAPARVFPAPRPPRITQDRQSPAGGNWWGCAQNSKR